MNARPLILGNGVYWSRAYTRFPINSSVHCGFIYTLYRIWYALPHMAGHILKVEIVALAAVLTLRSLAGFGFPLFAPTMYEHLGYGKGDTILAAFAVAIGCPAYDYVMA